MSSRQGNYETRTTQINHINHVVYVLEAKERRIISLILLFFLILVGYIFQAKNCFTKDLTKGRSNAIL